MKPVGFGVGLVLALILAPALAASAAAVGLRSLPELAPNSDALPRIVGPDTRATRKINRAFEGMDRDWLELVQACRADGHDDVGRIVRVNRNGPDFLSITVGYEVYCGGAHGSGGTEPFIYDLKTGSPVNWARLLPRFQLESRPGNLGETPLGYFTSASFRAAYVRAVSTAPDTRSDARWREECLPVLQDDDLAFHAYPDEEKPELLVFPATLAHVVRACGDPWRLTVSDLRQIGADARLIALIQAID